jgi:hypothetical protein
VDPFDGISTVWDALMVGVGAAAAHYIVSWARGITMSVIHFHAATASTPEQFIASLTDFGPGRSEIFKNSPDSYLTVHNKGFHQAEVTVGKCSLGQAISNSVEASKPGARRILLNDLRRCLDRIARSQSDCTPSGGQPRTRANNADCSLRNAGSAAGGLLGGPGTRRCRDDRRISRRDRRISNEQCRSRSSCPTRGRS